MPSWTLSQQGTLGKTAITTGANKNHYRIAQLSFIPKYCKLPAHMHDKVSVVDGFSFWFSSRNSFQGAKSIVMQTSIVFGPNFRKRGAKVSEGAAPVEKSQASDSIM